MDERYKNPDNDSRGIWTATDLTRTEYRDRDYWGLVTPSGKTVFPAKGRSWSRPKENIEKLITEGRLWFGPNGSNLPRLKKYLNEMDGGVTPQSIWLHAEVGNNQAPHKPACGTENTAAKNRPTKRHARASLIPKYRNSIANREALDKSGLARGLMRWSSKAFNRIDVQVSYGM